MTHSIETLRYSGVNVFIITVSRWRRLHVSAPAKLMRTSEMARTLHATIAINGDGWGLPGVEPRKPNSIAYSDGRPVQTRQKDWRPWINVDRNNRVSFGWKNPYNLYNAVSGDRFIVEHGAYNNKITDNSVDARTAIGATPENTIIIVVAEGDDTQRRGLTFRQLGDIFVQRGAVTAINLDGGGSSTLWYEDQLMTRSSDGVEREVINHVLIWDDDSSPAPELPPQDEYILYHSGGKTRKFVPTLS